jgi:hypothetical protein
LPVIVSIFNDPESTESNKNDRPESKYPVHFKDAHVAQQEDHPYRKKKDPPQKGLARIVPAVSTPIPLKPGNPAFESFSFPFPSISVHDPPP